MCVCVCVCLCVCVRALCFCSGGVSHPILFAFRRALPKLQALHKKAPEDVAECPKLLASAMSSGFDLRRRTTGRLIDGQIPWARSTLKEAPNTGLRRPQVLRGCAELWIGIFVWSSCDSKLMVLWIDSTFIFVDHSSFHKPAVSPGWLMGSGKQGSPEEFRSFPTFMFNQRQVSRL